MMLVRKFIVFLVFLSLAGCSSTAWVADTQSPTRRVVSAAASLPTASAAHTALPPTHTLEIPTAIPTQVPKPEYMVLIVLDAFRPEYLSLAEMPNLKSLIQRGTSYSGAWTGGLENYTPSAHTMLSTGSFPGRNGILGYTWGNFQTGETYNPTTLEAVNRGEMAAIVEKSGVPTLAGAIKARWPSAIVAALSDEKYYAAQSLGMGPSDYILYSVHEDGSDITVPAAVHPHTAPQEFMTDPDLRSENHQPGGGNAYALQMAGKLVEKYRPRAVLLNLPETDDLSHVTGGLPDPDAMRVVLDATDRALGGLMETYRQSGIFDQTLWVVTSDHGMTPKEDIIVPAELFDALGIQLNPEDIAPLPNMRLKDPSQAAPIAEKIAAAKVPGILGVYSRVKNGSTYTYQAAPSTLAGLSPELNGAFLYLMGTYAGPYSPDVVVTTSGNTAFDKQHESQGGSHNMDNWADQHIFMAFAGPGIANGILSKAPARLVDILPTIAQVMNLPLSGADGVVLADAVQNPTAIDLAKMDEMNKQLSPLRDAFAATGK